MVPIESPRLQATKPFALDGSFLGRGVMLRLRLRWSGGRIAREAQERTRHVYDYRGVLKHDESTRRVKLPLELSLIHI